MTDDTKIINPIEKTSASSARKLYINDIADKIESLVTTENFYANDIMVLVQKRKPFVPILVNELKSRNIDVAGNDRIILPEFPAIRDLLNIVRFCMDNSDDYSLCCTLKSPIYRLKERDIFKICQLQKIAKKDDKTANIFDILKTEIPDIHSELSEIIQWSNSLAPYSFFSRLLNTNNRREKMIAALGTQIIDPLEEFLTICLSYERTQPGTLKHFLKWFMTSGTEIKRDMDASSGVRIITVHGSKGLESPIVFLIDTVRTPKINNTRTPITVNKKDKSLSGFENWVWTPQSNTSDKFKTISEESMSEQISEYYRLLYVAMTRARDRLYIYGFNTNKNPPEIAWHTKLSEILSESETESVITIQ